jgi:hypothetical protein
MDGYLNQSAGFWARENRMEHDSKAEQKNIFHKQANEGCLSKLAKNQVQKARYFMSGSEFKLFCHLITGMII